MKQVIREEKADLNGTTIRLLKCRDENDRKVGPSRNELVASAWDSQKTKYRDFIRMVVADTLPEAMPQFLAMSVKEIAKLLPKYKSTTGLAKTDCQTVQSYDKFAEALQRR